MGNTERDKAEAMVAIILNALPDSLESKKKKAILFEVNNAIRLFFELPKIEASEPSFKEIKKKVIRFAQKLEQAQNLFNSMHPDERHTIERIVDEGLGGDFDLWFLMDNISTLASSCARPDKFIDVLGSKGGRKYDFRTRNLILDLAEIYRIGTDKEPLDGVRAKDSANHKEYTGEFLDLVFNCLVAAGERPQLAGEGAIDALGEMIREVLVFQSKQYHE